MAEQPDEEAIKKWHRWFANEANNRAWTLTEAETRTECEQSEMLRTAYASAYHWSVSGTERNRALSDLLLARVHAILGSSTLALQHAQAAYDHITSRQADSWELAFAHAILAHAATAAGDQSRYVKHYQMAQQIGETLDGEEKDIFLATFNRIPVLSVLASEHASQGTDQHENFRKE